MTRNDLTARQKRFLQALLTSKSAREAAHKCGIGEKTAYRWLRQPAFREALQEAESGLLEEAMRRLLSMQSGALDALSDLVTDRRLPGARLAAAKTVLDAVLRFRNAVELEARITDLERRIDEAAAQAEPPTD
ncbi:hypothetical protein BECAL_02228 [Bellilinea caldifistulae]|uniref:Uncharacterized protein n=1 Tax=Bellilinea caldifistulae TaxID=360411 RepID=A0A0P6WU53_9CHLR|nr:phBC6A51 family helix-turn-helix protein [Bellilinea caldifistulae]KPL73782.1 hypothetical protein AC812_13350 [Bellilinea caldifistulae]GAP11046.1 hypothetical protein BECAL_02228 [Bellilinea caldifistulae]